jgi:hypothetical protein
VGVAGTELVLAHVAGRRGQRYADGPSDALGLGQLDVARLDLDVHVRLEARDADGKNVGRFPGHHDHLLAPGLGFLVLVFCRLAVLQLGLDLRVAEGYLDAGDRRVARKREAVTGFDDLIALLLRKAVRLGQTQRSHGARDVARQVGPAERRKNEFVVLCFLFVDELQDADTAGTGVLKSGFVKDTYSSLFILNLPRLLSE